MTKENRLENARLEKVNFTRETADAQLKEIKQFLQTARQHLAKIGL